MKLSESVRRPLVRRSSDPVGTTGINTSNGDTKRAKTVNFKTAARVVQLAVTTPADGVDDDVFNDPAKQLKNRKKFQESVNHQVQEPEKSETPGKILNEGYSSSCSQTIFHFEGFFSFFFVYAEEGFTLSACDK